MAVREGLSLALPKLYRKASRNINATDRGVVVELKFSSLKFTAIQTS
jgi:hypothetical protein